MSIPGTTRLHLGFSRVKAGQEYNFFSAFQFHLRTIQYAKDPTAMYGKTKTRRLLAQLSTLCESTNCSFLHHLDSRRPRRPSSVPMTYPNSNRHHNYYHQWWSLLLFLVLLNKFLYVGLSIKGSILVTEV